MYCIEKANWNVKTVIYNDAISYKVEVCACKVKNGPKFEYCVEKIGLIEPTEFLSILDTLFGLESISPIE
jgi:hypothetical protein